MYTHMCAYMYICVCVCTCVCMCVCMCVYTPRACPRIFIFYYCCCCCILNILLLSTTVAIPARRVVTKSLAKIRRWSLEEESVPFGGQRAGTRPRSRVER